MVPESYHDEKNLIEMDRGNLSERDQEICLEERNPSEMDPENFLEETNLSGVGLEKGLAEMMNIVIFNVEKDLHQEMNHEEMAPGTFCTMMDQ